MVRILLAIGAIAPLLLALIAKQYIKAVYESARQVAVASNVTGGEAAHLLLHATGNMQIRVETAKGQLTDHFDAAAGVIRLSPDTHDEASIAALAIVGHEMGHLAQFQIGSWLMYTRNVLLQAAQIASGFGTLLMALGLAAALLRIGPGQFAIVGGFISLFLSAAFAVITIPLEYDASRRALRLLVASNLLTDEELPGVRRVLNAAALSYAASAIMTVSRLPFLLGRFFR